MAEKKSNPDAYQWSYDRYVKGDPDLEAFCEELRVRARIAGQIYSIRNRLGMTQDQLAELSGLTVATIDDLEESDYEGNLQDAIERINGAFRRRFSEVIVPAARMKPEEYSVEAVNT